MDGTNISALYQAQQERRTNPPRVITTLASQAYRDRESSTERQSLKSGGSPAQRRCSSLPIWTGLS